MPAATEGGNESRPGNLDVKQPESQRSPVLKSGEFRFPARQSKSGEVFSAQPSNQEHQTQPQDGHPVTRKRRGPREKPPEHARSGELYVGSLIRKLRNEKGLQVEQAAALLGYSRAALSHIETNRYVPSEEKLQKIAELLEVPVSDLKQAPEHPRIWQTPIEKLKKMSFDQLAKHQNRLRPQPRFHRLP